MCTKTDQENNVAAASVATTATNFGSPNVHVTRHPMLAHKLTILRSSKTPPSSFRAVLREVTHLLAYEATSSLKTRSVPVSVQQSAAADDDGVDDGGIIVDNTVGVKLADKIAIVPIMRSGLGMTDGMLELVPNAAVHHIGMYKDSTHNTPIQYYNRLPRQCNADWAFVVDPVIATSSTVMSVVGILKRVSFFRF